MARQHEGFFAGYDPAELEQEATLTLTHADLLLIRMALGVSLDETSRHDHIYNNIHALLAKLPPAPDRKDVVVDVSAPSKWLNKPTR
jgi:hypothetical protein